MGAGWIVFKEKDSEKQLITDFSCALMNWPSSTRAELEAITTALFATPMNAKVTIIMDSAAAIQAIKRSQEIYKLREGLKIKNGSILWHIQRLKKLKNIELHLKKIKGHSNIWENDAADKLAKEGAQRGLILEFKDPWNNLSKVIARWKNIRLDSALRSSINRIVLGYSDVKWANMKCIQKWVEPKEMRNKIV